MRVVLILALFLTGTCGCSSKAEFSCAENLKTRILVGASMEAAEAAVKDCGLEYSVDKSRRVLHAIKRGEKRGTTQQSRVVIIMFDQSDRVSSIEVKPEYTGP